MHSLRARLLWTVSIATLLVWSSAGVISYYTALHEAEELMDGQLAQSSKQLLAQAMHQGLVTTRAITKVLDTSASHPYEQHLEFLVWGNNGGLLLRSRNAPETFLSEQTRPVQSAGRHTLFTDIQHAGQPWRLLSTSSPDGRYRVQVAHPSKDRERVGLEVAAQVSIPILLGLPLLGLLVYFSVRRALHPLDKLAAAVTARSPDNLEALTEPNAPQETKPLLDALNRLLTRLSATLENERRFTADAAHELRTPLAAVKIQAQVALASADVADLEHALRQVLAGADRATRLVEQLLRLARLDPLAGLTQAGELDLVALTAEVVGDLKAQAARKQQQLRLLASTAPIKLQGDIDLLRVALRNLIENALRYTPEQGVIEVAVSSVAARPALVIRDTGPGVAEEDIPRLTERFFRGQASSGEGSGLGLAIVKRIAQLHGAVLDFDNRVGGGLEVRLRWLGKIAARKESN